MNSVPKSTGQTAVYSTPSPSQPEEQKPAESRPEPEKRAQAPAQSNAAERGNATEQAFVGELRAEQMRTQLINGLNSKAVEQIQDNFRARFNALSTNKQEFHLLMKEVYGQNYDAASAESFRLRALKGDFNWLPKIEVESNFLNGFADDIWRWICLK